MTVVPDKALAGLVSLTALIPSIFTNDITTPIIGVGVSTVAGAVLGTYAAIGYDLEARPRGKLFAMATATVIIASSATGVVPQWLGWQWVNGGVEGGAAALAAVICYYTLPEIIPTVRRIIREFKLSDIAFFRKRVASGTDEPKPPAPIDGEPDK